MSKLETNTIDTISGSNTLTLGGTNLTTVNMASGVSPGAGMGKVLQIQYGIRDTEFSTTSNGYVDVSNMTFTLTPKSTSSKILVFAFGRSGSGAGNVEIRWRILRDSTTVNAGRDMFSVSGGGVYSASIFCFGIDQPNSTSSLTYKLQGLCENNVDTARIVANNNEVNQEAYLVGIELAG